LGHDPYAPGREPDPPVRVVVVDDHPAIGVALAALAREGAPIRVVATARTADEASAIVAPEGTPGAVAADVILLDIQLDGEAEGLRLLPTLVETGPAVVMLTSYDQPALIRTAFERGARGYVLKTAAMDELVQAILTVARGGTAFTAAALDAVRHAARHPSDRETEVLGLIVGGASNDEIGARLGLSHRTVESHLRRLFERYGVLSRTELAVLALREGWVAAGPSER
jgi:DNA-binding NarL/FixJ family response regulator